MVMESLMLNVTTFNSGLDATVAPETFAIPARPVDGVLVSVVDPILVIIVN